LLKDRVQCVLRHCHASTYGRHFGIDKAIAKVLRVGLTAHSFQGYKEVCDGMWSMPKNGKYFKEAWHASKWYSWGKIFDVRGTNFMGLFPTFPNNLYIVVAVDYVSRWVKVIATLPVILWWWSNSSRRTFLQD